MAYQRKVIFNPKKDVTPIWQANKTPSEIPLRLTARAFAPLHCRGRKSSTAATPPLRMTRRRRCGDDSLRREAERLPYKGFLCFDNGRKDSNICLFYQTKASRNTKNQRTPYQIACRGGVSPPTTKDICPYVPSVIPQTNPHRKPSPAGKGDHGVVDEESDFRTLFAQARRDRRPRRS